MDQSVNPNKLTIKAQEALQATQAIAQERGHQALEIEHLLLALLNQKEGVVPATLERIGVSLDRLRSDLEKALDKKTREEAIQVLESLRENNLEKATFAEKRNLLAKLGIKVYPSEDN